MLAIPALEVEFQPLGKSKVELEHAADSQCSGKRLIGLRCSKQEKRWRTKGARWKKLRRRKQPNRWWRRRRGVVCEGSLLLTIPIYIFSNKQRSGRYCP